MRRRWKCPICQKPVQPREPEFPFCSRRCRVIDLGRWASGGYVVSTPLTDPEAFGAGESRPDDAAEEKRKKRE